VFQFLAFEGRDAPMVIMALRFHLGSRVGEWLTFEDESLGLFFYLEPESGRRNVFKIGNACLTSRRRCSNHFSSLFLVTTVAGHALH
jgi:hypothetical protein